MDDTASLLPFQAPTDTPVTTADDGDSSDSTVNAAAATTATTKSKTITTTTTKKKTKKKHKVFINKEKTTSSSLSSSCAGTTSRVGLRRRHPKLVFVPVRRGCVSGCGGGGGGEVEAIALPLGMSFAAVVTQVLERKDIAGEKISVDHLAMICTSAVQESLANVFGNKFNFFVRNFEKSFGSTLKTLRLINESSFNKPACNLIGHEAECSAKDVILNGRVDCTSNLHDSHPGSNMPTVSSSSGIQVLEDRDENMSPDCLNQELALRAQVNQLVHAPPSSDSVVNRLNSFEKSVMEQRRSNDLKTVEIGLTMRKLKLKEAQLALSFDSNHLERSKLAVGISKASFKAEKFKTQLEDSRKAELLKKCIDCLVAGLFIMSFSLLYGTYVFSYQRITEATASCSPVESRSSWIPKPFSGLNTGINTLWCQFQVLSRMLFGILVILAIGYLLLQRSAAPHQTMPITIILLLLGAACGLAGKFCVDTLGGSGLKWFLYWEAFCLLHFLSIIWPSLLFRVLYGPVAVSQAVKHKVVCPYWLRRFLFYYTSLVLLPLCCGLLPFAGLSQWKDHVLLLASDFLPGIAY